MTRARWIGIVVGACLLIGALTVASPPCHAQIPRIVVQATDTAVFAGDTCWINVYLSNFQDSIAAYQFLLRLNRPDLVQFDTLAGFDTTGTLTSGFEAVVTNDTSSTAALMLVTGLADFPDPPRIQPPILPQSGGLLIKLPLLTNPQPDTTGGLTCEIDFVGPVRFVDPSANIIGQVVDTIVDTIYFKCDEWVGDSCARWIEVDGSLGGYDSVAVDSSLYGWIDSTQVIVNPGSLLLLTQSPFQCDYNSDSTYTIDDLLSLVNCLFLSIYPNPCANHPCDCNGSGNPTEPDIADLTCMVAFLFQGGPPPGP